MKCPKCFARMLIQDSRPTSDQSRVREYACTNCEEVYLSTEALDLKPINKEPHRRMKYRERDY